MQAMEEAAHRAGGLLSQRIALARGLLSAEHPFMTNNVFPRSLVYRTTRNTNKEQPRCVT